MIDKYAATQATRDDEQLLKAVHPVGAPLLHIIAKTGPLRRIPKVGVIVSKASLIREIYMDRTNFTKMGEGASGGLWTPVIGDSGLVNMDGDLHLQLKRNLAPAFSNKICPAIVGRVLETYSGTMKTRLLAGEEVDIVQEVANFAYRTLWELIGLPQSRLSDVDFSTAVTALRSVTEGMTMTKKNLSADQVNTARGKLSFVESLARETYQNATDSTSIPGLMKAEGFDEEAAISVVKSLMVTGTETIISFLPRMTALFITSGYINHVSQNREHLSKGIEEALRVVVPTPVAARIAKNDITFHGVKIKAGERMVLSSDPFQELDREVKGLWFGAGVHMCIGLPLALAEANGFADILLDVHNEAPLMIADSKISNKGHTGSYERLVLKCKTSSNV
jgi:cytochrome P450